MVARRGPLPGWPATANGAEDVHRLVEGDEELPRWQQTRPACGKLDRQRKAVEASADLCDVFQVVARIRETGIYGRGSVDEQAHGWGARCKAVADILGNLPRLRVKGQPPDGIALFALCMQRLP